MRGFKQFGGAAIVRAGVFDGDVEQRERKNLRLRAGTSPVVSADATRAPRSPSDVLVLPTIGIPAALFLL